MKRLLILFALAGCGEILGGGDEYKGSFSGVLYQETLTAPRKPDGSGGVTCVTTYTLSGSVRLNLKESGNAVSGEGTVDINENPVSISPAGCGMGPPRRFDVGGPISGPRSGFQFSGGYNSAGAGVVDTTRVEFAGSLLNNSASGTIALRYSGAGVGVSAGSVSSGSAQFGVTITR